MREECIIYNKSRAGLAIVVHSGENARWEEFMF